MRTRELQFAILSLMLMLILIIPPVREKLEMSMTTHVALQLGGLAIAGWFMGAALRRRVAHVSRILNSNGLCGLAICLFAALFWMLPRTLDDALGDPRIEVAKFLTIPLLVGFPLALSWPCLSPIMRGFLKASLISKLMVLGWIYAAAPVRLCTSYFQSDQIILGELLVLLAGVLAVAWSLPWFFSEGPAENPFQKSQAARNDGAVLTGSAW